MSVVACSSDDNNGFPSTDAGKKDAAAGDDDDDDDDDDASVTKDGGTKDTGPIGDAGTVDTGTVSSNADIYACGAPSDCTAGNNCYLTAYADWDGGNFYSNKCGLVGANGNSVCKPSGTASDTQVCARLGDAGGYTACPNGTTCQVVGIYGKNFGACLVPGSYDAGCDPTKRFIPYQGDPNYCFGSNSAGGADGGCTGSTTTCCDAKVDGGFTNSCVANASACD